MTDAAVKQEASFLGYRVSGVRANLSPSMTNAQPHHSPLFSDMTIEDASIAVLPPSARADAAGSLAFILGSDLTSIDDIQSAADAIELVFPAIDLASGTGDGRDLSGSGAGSRAEYVRVAIGDGGLSPSDFDLDCCGAVFELNGEIRETSAGAAILGHPAVAILSLAQTLGCDGTRLKRGDVIVVSGLTRSIPVSVGDHVRLTVGGLGSCGLRLA
jgi:2-oxopent-4-enoate/cis-2-oxohex-4-enoate hydratase